MQYREDWHGGLRKWIDRPKWNRAFNEYVDAIFGEIYFGLGCDNFDRFTGRFEPIVEAAIWSFAFEDFLTTETRHGNIIDAYLDQGGKREDAECQALIRAAKQSRVSLYEVVETGNDTLVIRDLLDTAEPIAISPRKDLAEVTPGDQLALRLLEADGSAMQSGVTLKYPRDDSKNIIAQIEEYETGIPDLISDMMEEAGSDDSGAGIYQRLGQDLAGQSVPPILLQTWLVQVYPSLFAAALGGGEKLGESKVVYFLRYTLKRGVTHRKIQKEINKLRNFVPSDENVWDWVGVANSGLRIFSDYEDGAEELGVAVLIDRGLEVMVDTPELAARAESELTPVLKKLAGKPQIVQEEI